VTARSDNSDAILEALVAREIQLALIEGPEQRKDLRIEPFMEDHMVLVVPSGHEWANHEVEVGEFCRHRLLLREFGSGSRRVVEQCLAAVGLKEKALCAAMEFDSNEGLLSAVEAGLGVTFVSRWAVRNQLSLGTLKLARIRRLKPFRKFSMAYPAGPDPVGNVGAFRAILLTRSLDLAPRTMSSQC
jgi:DNA-binding transcriptional LysR family regulator